MSLYYGTIEDVLRDSSVSFSDFNFNSDLLDDEKQAYLEDMIEQYLIEIKNFIDTDRNRDYHQEVENGELAKIPEGINSIARRACRNMLAVTLQRRNSPITTYEDFSNTISVDIAFSKELMYDLRRFPQKRRFGIFLVGPEEEENE